jgi:hypothetical protein
MPLSTPNCRIRLRLRLRLLAALVGPTAAIAPPIAAQAKPSIAALQIVLDRQALSTRPPALCLFSVRNRGLPLLPPRRFMVGSSWLLPSPPPDERAPPRLHKLLLAIRA